LVPTFETVTSYITDNTTVYHCENITFINTAPVWHSILDVPTGARNIRTKDDPIVRSIAA
jgi:hypothetical protein